MRFRTIRCTIPAAVLVLGVHFGGTGLASGAPHTHGADSELPAGTYTQASIYQLTSTWTTPAEQRMPLGALRGKARVLVMYYTSCEYACPVLVSIMKNIEAALEPQVHERVGFVAVSFDPERDTPAALRAYSDKMQLDAQHWTLLRGQADDVLELAVLLGVKFKQEAHGDFSHSNLITVLNKEGEIVYRHTGLHHPVADTIAAIRRVARE